MLHARLRSGNRRQQVQQQVLPPAHRTSLHPAVIPDDPRQQWRRCDHAHEFGSHHLRVALSVREEAIIGAPCQRAGNGTQHGRGGSDGQHHLARTQPGELLLQGCREVAGRVAGQVSAHGDGRDDTCGGGEGQGTLTIRSHAEQVQCDEPRHDAGHRHHVDGLGGHRLRVLIQHGLPMAGEPTDARTRQRCPQLAARLPVRAPVPVKPALPCAALATHQPPGGVSVGAIQRHLREHLTHTLSTGDDPSSRQARVPADAQRREHQRMSGHVYEPVADACPPHQRSCSFPMCCCTRARAA